MLGMPSKLDGNQSRLRHWLELLSPAGTAHRQSHYCHLWLSSDINHLRHWSNGNSVVSLANIFIVTNTQVNAHDALHEWAPK